MSIRNDEIALAGLAAEVELAGFQCDYSAATYVRKAGNGAAPGERLPNASVWWTEFSVYDSAGKQVLAFDNPHKYYTVEWLADRIREILL